MLRTYGILLSAIAVSGNVAEDARQLQSCGNGEVMMPAWERGLDGRLQKRGIYCYRDRPREDVGRWTTDEEGAPVRVRDGDD